MIYCGVSFLQTFKDCRKFDVFRKLCRNKIWFKTFAQNWIFTLIQYVESKPNHSLTFLAPFPCVAFRTGANVVPLTLTSVLTGWIANSWKHKRWTFLTWRSIHFVFLWSIKATITSKVTTQLKLKISYQFGNESQKSHWDRHRCWASHTLLHSDRPGYTELQVTHRVENNH